MNEKLLSVRGLARRFGKVQAVVDATFDLKEGLVTAFLGENGAGKTTTIKMILGFIRKSGGDIVRTARLFGYVAEQPGFFPWLTGEDVLDCTARLHGIPRILMMERLRVGCEKLFFDRSLLERKVSTYSNGNRKKLAYLQNIVFLPEILIVDETFAALDPGSIRAVRSLFGEFKDSGAAVLLSTHLIAEIGKIYDSVIIIKRGVVVLEADKAHLGPDPDLESLFFQAIPFAGIRRELTIRGQGSINKTSLRIGEGP
jgi:ABC-type multidrug transport system ATPase subunit